MRGLLSAAFFAVILAGCAPGISQQELLSRIESGRAPLLLDVRTEGEYRDGHIPGAVNISVFSFRERFEELDPPKDRPVVVICEHGPRASFAGFMLKSAGYEQVFNLEGAMTEWKRNKLPLEK